MKYCPYCGAVLLDGAVSFCSECGKALPDGLVQHQNQVPSTETSVQQLQPDNSETSITEAAADTIQEEKAASKKKDSLEKRKKKQKKRRSRRKSDRQPEEEPKDDGYDGYYDDVLPVDAGRMAEGMDQELIKKIVLLAVSALLVVGACVAMMYLL